MSLRTAFEIALVLVIAIQNRHRIAEGVGAGVLWVGRRFGWTR